MCNLCQSVKVLKWLIDTTILFAPIICSNNIMRNLDKDTFICYIKTSSLWQKHVSPVSFHVKTTQLQFSSMTKLRNSKYLYFKNSHPEIFIWKYFMAIKWISTLFLYWNRFTFMIPMLFYPSLVDLEQANDSNMNKDE